MVLREVAQRVRCFALLFATVLADADRPMLSDPIHKSSPPILPTVIPPLGRRSLRIDLTAAPYFCDPTGREDCTAAIRRAFDDAMREDREQVLATNAYLRSPGAKALSFEAQPERHVLAPHVPTPRVLYFPKGTYLVSDTLGYSFTDMLNSSRDHYARMIHIEGESREETVIRLADGAPGFDDPHGRPVLQILRGLKTAIAMQNTVENLTIDTGSGNPGAIGLDFFVNNTGALRDVTVRSGDGSGKAGVAITKWNSSCAFLQHVRVAGFEVGVSLPHHRLYSVMEDIEVAGQSCAGVHVGDHNVSIHRLRSLNRVPALVVTGSAAHVVAADIVAEGGSDTSAAVDIRAGTVFLRQIVSQGYGRVVDHAGGFPVPGDLCAEWTSRPTFTLFPDQSARSLNLPVENPPPRPGGVLADLSELVGDGQTDDTDAIEAALNCGAPRLVFPPGNFLLSRPLRIPAHVCQIDFGFSSLSAGEGLKQMEDDGVFLVGDGTEPLIIERLFTNVDFEGSQRLIVQDGVRTLVLRDLQTQNNPLYRNTVPGSKVFIENCACTCQDHEHLIPFAFTGQRVWARQLNPERARVQVLNDGGDLWVLGFKTENPSTAFHTRNGGRTEILGGIFNQLRQYHADGHHSPTIINDNSSVTVSASTTDWRFERSFEGPAHVMVREIRGDEHMDLVWEVLPLRMNNLAGIPLYTGRIGERTQ